MASTLDLEKLQQELHKDFARQSTRSKKIAALNADYLDLSKRLKLTADSRPLDSGTLAFMASGSLGEAATDEAIDKRERRIAGVRRYLGWLDRQSKVGPEAGFRLVGNDAIVDEEAWVSFTASASRLRLTHETGSEAADQPNAAEPTARPVPLPEPRARDWRKPRRVLSPEEQLLADEQSAADELKKSGMLIGPANTQIGPVRRGMAIPQAKRNGKGRKAGR